MKGDVSKRFDRPAAPIGRSHRDSKHSRSFPTIKALLRHYALFACRLLRMLSYLHEKGVALAWAETEF